MIAISRQRTAKAIPKAFRDAGLRDKAGLLIDLYYAAAASGTPIAFKSSAWKPAKAALKRETAGKCAYCECPTSSTAHGDVEHFRPKSVYWWLAHCYDNYLFSCQICNQTYKGNEFPISGTRLTAVAMPAAEPADAERAALSAALTLDPTAVDEAALLALWGGEGAHLVHPCLEDPAPLFAYEEDPANEEVWVRSAGGARADAAMEASDRCLGINREELRRQRYTVFAPFAVFKDVLDHGIADPARSRVLTQIKRMQRADEPFAGMVRWYAARWGLSGPS